MKRGQITIYATLGVVMIIGIGLFLFLLRDVPEETEFEAPHEISFFVKTCAENLLDEGLEIVSRQGGYIYTPEPFVVAYGYGIPIVDAPFTIEPIENELENYVDDNMAVCIDLSGFEGFDMDLFTSSITEVALSDTSLTANTLFIYEGKAYEAAVTRETYLKTLIDLSNDILKIHQTNGVDMVALGIMQSANDVYIEAIDWPINTIIYYLEKGDSFFGFAVEG